LVHSTRFKYADHIVPHLPPSLAVRHMFAAVPFTEPYVHRFDLDYVSVGRLQYIEQDDSVVDDSATLRFTRFENLARLIATGRFDEIIADHASHCHAGYMNGVCPTELCA